ncbi:MAG: fatty acid desaturase [Coleofasciculaceae cyanobacterium]
MHTNLSISSPLDNKQAQRAEKFDGWKINPSAKDNEIKRPYERYEFSREIRSKLAPCFQIDNWHCFLQVGEDWLAIALACGCSIWAWQNLAFFLALPIYLIAVTIIGARQRGLRVNNHQATHKALAKNKVLNYIMGSFLSGYLALESFSGYNASHSAHHRYTGDGQRDSDLIDIIKHGLYGEERTARVKRYLVQIPLHIPRYIQYLLQNRIWNIEEDKQERLVKLTYLAVLSAIILYCGWGVELLIYWIVPLLTTANWFGTFIELSEHYPMMQTAPKVDIYMSRNRLLSPFLNFFMGTHQENMHLVHHLFAGIPMWRLTEAHHILMEDSTYATLNQEKGLGNLVKQIVTDE